MERGMKGVLAIIALLVLMAACTGTDPRCDMTPDEGSGSQIIAKYYYDGKNCVDFPWSGSDGRVPFDSYQECREACIVPALEKIEHIVYTTDMSEDPAPYREECERQGGEFSECGSSCPLDAELCIEVCAYTCDIEKS